MNSKIEMEDTIMFLIQTSNKIIKPIVSAK